MRIEHRLVEKNAQDIRNKLNRRDVGFERAVADARITEQEVEQSDARQEES